MDFDKPKVYGDTSITDGPVLNLGKVNNAMIAIMVSMLSADLGHTADCSNSDK